MRVPAAFVLLALVAGCGSSSSRAAEPFRVLVTNDDGVRADGISALVEALRANPNLDLVVFAPAVNQSGSGDSFSTGPIVVTPAETGAGFAATAVGGEPADSVLFAVQHALAEPPDLIVSGINFGQNLGEFVYLSGTIGAARWGARLGIPGIAVSQGFPAKDYTAAAAYTAKVVERFRTDASFRRLLNPPDAAQALILNINVPTCATGAQRGIEVVPVGHTTQVVSYELVDEDGDAQIFQPQVEMTSAFTTDCTSTLTNPSSDIEAMANGFASITPLGPDLTQESLLDRFDFLKQL